MSKNPILDLIRYYGNSVLKLLFLLALTPPSGACARPPAGGSLRSPTPLPPLAAIAPRPAQNTENENREKNISQKNLSCKKKKNLQPKKKSKKKSWKFFRNFFFFDFPKFFSVEIFHMLSTLRMQNYTIIAQGVPEIQGVTDTHTDKLSPGFII